MGLLHNLWDETLAGPPPEKGLGRLRKYKSFSVAAKSTTTVSPPLEPPPREDRSRSVSRSITIVQNNARRKLNVDIGSLTDNLSPSSSSEPSSPFSPISHGGNFNTPTRRKSTPWGGSESTSPIGYDWIILSAWER